LVSGDEDFMSQSTALSRDERSSPACDKGDDVLDIVWGAAEIGRIIGKSARATHYWLHRGEIRAARRLGDQWYASRAGLREQFCGPLATSTHP
jgi:hypothetical protein